MSQPISSPLPKTTPQLTPFRPLIFSLPSFNSHLHCSPSSRPLPSIVCLIPSERVPPGVATCLPPPISCLASQQGKKRANQRQSAAFSFRAALIKAGTSQSRYRRCGGVCLLCFPPPAGLGSPSHLTPLPPSLVARGRPPSPRLLCVGV